MAPTRAELLIVTPHPSGAVPADVLLDMLGAAAFDTARREAFLHRLFQDGDPYTDLIYATPGARHLQAPWSRFAADLNRHRDDRDPNGVLKETGFDLQPLYPPGFAFTPAAREARLRRLWDPFHAQLHAELTSGTRLVIVGHSMAPTGPALGPDPGTPRPVLCLMPGTPQAPTFPPALWPALQAACEQAFQEVIPLNPDPRVTVGEPWDTDTLSVHAERAGVPAFGVEINAGLFMQAGRPMDEPLRRLNAAFARFADAALSLL